MDEGPDWTGDYENMDGKDVPDDSDDIEEDHSSEGFHMVPDQLDNS